MVCSKEAVGGLCIELGKRVQLARKHRKWTQSELAAAVGFSRSSIANLETGRQRPPAHIALLIARALGVHVGELLPSAGDLGKTAWEPSPDPAERAAGDQRPASFSEEALRMLYAEIGARVRHARQRRGCATQIGLAQAVGLTPASITNLEAGRQRPPVHVALLIAQALEVPVGDLLPSR